MYRGWVAGALLHLKVNTESQGNWGWKVGLGHGWRHRCDPEKWWVRSWLVMTSLYLNIKHWKIQNRYLVTQTWGEIRKHWWEQIHQGRKNILRKVSYVWVKLFIFILIKQSHDFAFFFQITSVPGNTLYLKLSSICCYVTPRQMAPRVSFCGDVFMFW